MRLALVLSLGALALAHLPGCGAGPVGSASIASYTQSNVMAPSGYSEKQLDDTHYEVRANGTETTPRAHVERIAMARAAEIGIERRLQYFKVMNVTHGYVCTPRREVYKMGPTPATRYPTVSLDVVYAKTPEPDFLKAGDTFQHVKAEIDGAVVAPEESAAAAEELRARCNTQ